MPTRSFSPRHVLFSALLGCGIALTAAPLAVANAAEAISFDAGSPWSQTIGSVSKDMDFHEYTINAHAGKTLQINLISRNPNLFFRVLPADSRKPLVDTASSGETSWSTKPEADGSYIVRVYVDPDTVSGNDATRYALQVGIF